jgi:HSP20 family protein
MTLVPYEPWNVVRKFHNDVDWLFNHSSLERPDVDGSRGASARWVPAVDITEENGQYVLRADVPGVDAKDIDITVENDTLTVKGERTAESKDKQDGYKRIERVRGSFYRRVFITHVWGGEHKSAKSNKRVVEVTIPKQEKVQPRRIKVAA